MTLYQNGSEALEMLKTKKGMTIIGDLHGNYHDAKRIVDEARQKDYAIAFIGDITDRGPQSPDCIRLVLDGIEKGDTLYVPGNHCYKFARYANGNDVKISHGLDLTIEQLKNDPEGEMLTEQFKELVFKAPLFLKIGNYVLTHAAYAKSMAWIDSFPLEDKKTLRKNGFVFNRALYGHPEKDKKTEDGFPVQSLEWIDEIPENLIVVVGHNVVDHVITFRKGSKGGKAIHIDTGSGKGGPLSFLPVPLEDIKVEDVSEQDWTDSNGEPLLTILVGPSGSGKSTWAQKNFKEDEILSSDQIRIELFGSFETRESQVNSDRVFRELYHRASVRLSKGKRVVIDATHVRTRDRFPSYALVPPTAPIKMVVINRPVEEKEKTAGWRANHPQKNGMTLIEKQEQIFRSNLKDIMNADGRKNVQIIDLTSSGD